MFFTFLMFLSTAFAMPLSPRISTPPMLIWENVTLNGVSSCHETFSMGGNNGFTLDATCQGPCPTPLKSTPIGSVDDLVCGYKSFPTNLFTYETQMTFVQYPTDTCRWQLEACKQNGAYKVCMTKSGPSAFEFHESYDCNWPAMEKDTRFAYVVQQEVKSGILKPASMNDIQYAQPVDSTATQTNAQATQPTQTDSLSTGAIVGIVIGSIMAVGAIVGGIVWHYLHVKTAKKLDTPVVVIPTPQTQVKEVVQVMDTKVAY